MASEATLSELVTLMTGMNCKTVPGRPSAGEGCADVSICRAEYALLESWLPWKGEISGFIWSSSPWDSMVHVEMFSQPLE